MELPKKKIELYKTRTFSQKISDTFDFITENWKPLLKYGTYLLLPLSMVHAALEDFNYDNNGEVIDQIISMGVTLIIVVLCSIVGASLCYACMRLYAMREDRLQGLTGFELKPVFLHCLKRMSLLTFISFLVGGAFIAVMAVAFIGSLGNVGGVIVLLLMLGLLMFIVMTPLSLAYPIYLFESQTSILGAFSKAWRLGFATWGGTFAVIFILSLLIFMATGMLSMPYFIVSFSKLLTTANETASMGASTNVLTSMLQYLLGVISYFASYLLEIVLYIGLAYQYGHASDKIDGTGNNREIDQFEML